MWIMELFLCILIILMLSMPLYISEKLLPAIHFKENLNFVTTNIKINRYTNRYNSKYFNIKNDKEYILYHLKPEENTLHLKGESFFYKDKNFSMDTKNLISLDRLNAPEDYKTGTLTAFYTYKNGKKLSADITINRLGSLYLRHKEW